MHDAYYRKIISDILKKNKNNTRLTIQSAIQLIQSDELFLKSLIEPYITAILARAIDQVKRDVSSSKKDDNNQEFIEKNIQISSQDHINNLYVIAKKSKSKNN